MLSAEAERLRSERAEVAESVRRMREEVSYSGEYSVEAFMPACCACRKGQYSPPYCHQIGSDSLMRRAFGDNFRDLPDSFPCIKYVQYMP